MFVTQGNGLVDQHQKQSSLPLGEGREHKRATLTETTGNVSRLTIGN